MKRDIFWASPKLALWGVHRRAIFGGISLRKNVLEPGHLKVSIGNLPRLLSHPEHHDLDVACLELGTQLTVVFVAQACLSQSRFSGKIQPGLKVFVRQHFNSSNVYGSLLGLQHFQPKFT